MAVDRPEFDRTQLSLYYIHFFRSSPADQARGFHFHFKQTKSSIMNAVAAVSTLPVDPTHFLLADSHLSTLNVPNSFHKYITTYVIRQVKVLQDNNRLHKTQCFINFSRQSIIFDTAHGTGLIILTQNTADSAPVAATCEVTLNAQKVLSHASVGLQLVLLCTVYSQARGCVCTSLQLGGNVERPWVMSNNDSIHKTGST